MMNRKTGSEQATSDQITQDGYIECEQVPSLQMQGTASYFDISTLYISCDTVREMHVLAGVCAVVHCLCH